MTEPVNVDKVDPETLVLRAKPPRVIRIKRNVLIGVSAAGCLVLMGLTWLGLSPSLLQHGPARVEEKDPEKHKAGIPEQINALPKTYADVPQLGQPLPGDLGGPILEHQKRHQLADGVAETSHAASVARSATEPQTSGLFFQAATATGSAMPPPAVVIAGPNDQSLMKVGALPLPGPSRTAKVTFLESAVRSETVNPHEMQAPVSSRVVMAGTVISAALITGLNSDLPGLVLAQVTRDVSDVTGRRAVIPQGTRLIGKYDSTISFGQKRALIIWQRLIWPDGRSLEIDNMPATDRSGYAGLSDGVSFHTASLLKGIGLSTMLGITSELGTNSDNDLVEAMREAVQETANQAGQKIVARQIDVQPTLTVRPGWPLRVIVQKDLVIGTGDIDHGY